LSSAVPSGVLSESKPGNTHNLKLPCWEQLELFIENLFHPALRTHRLSGKLKDLWSFSIRYDMRVVSTFLEEKPKRALLIVMGTHDEVY
jgi:mRNA-degrading endonuclease YafQ of YafQ-DinJ toxin-antitoxin module